MKIKKNVLVGLSLACIVSIALASTSQNLNADIQTKDVIVKTDSTLEKANNILAQIEETKSNLVKKKELKDIPLAKIVKEKNTSNAVESNKTIKVVESFSKETEAVKKAKEEVEKCVNVNTCDTNRLKLAVAKLIDKVTILETRVSKLETAKTINPVRYMQTAKSIEKYKTICKDKKVYIPGKIEESYVKFKHPKYFRATTKLMGYETPELTSAILEEKAFKRGDQIVADMWTYAGWIHDKNKNMWVRGFKLSPKFNQKTPPKQGITYKVVKDCKKVKIQ